MKMPKFTAEESFYRSPVHHAETLYGATRTRGAVVRPAEAGDIETECTPCVRGRQFCRVFVEEFDCREVPNPNPFSPFPTIIECPTVRREIFKGNVSCHAGLRLGDFRLVARL